MKQRFESIDILRGIAVLQMIFWQIFDFFAKADIYSHLPYYFPAFDMPVNGIGLALFTFASGASVYISVRRRLQKGVATKNVILHSIKRYGGYILLSLVFTTFVFGFNLFYTWKEAVQGIGFAALIAALLIIFVKSRWFYLFLGLGLAFVQPFLRKAIETPAILANYPIDPTSFNIVINIVSLFLNSTIRGFFALTHTLPMLLLGVTLGAMIMKGKSIMKSSYILGSIMMATSIVMHFSGSRIDVYNWSTSYQIGFVGFSFLLLSLIEYLLKIVKKSKITNFLSLFGKTAIVAYVLHFVIIYKPLAVLGFESSLNQPISYVLAIFSVGVLYYICKLWIINKKSIFKIIRKLY